MKHGAEQVAGVMPLSMRASRLGVWRPIILEDMFVIFRSLFL